MTHILIKDDNLVTLRKEIAEFIDEQRDLCLWYLPENFYPSGKSSIIRILEKIQKHGDLNAYKKAEEIKWQLLHSKKKSVSF